MKNTQGQQLPMGVTVQEDGVSFSVAAKKGKACCLLLYHAGEKEPCARYPMRQSEGAVYTVKVTDIQSGAYAYEYLMDEEVVTDPYTKAFTKENKSQVLIPEYDWRMTDIRLMHIRMLLRTAFTCVDLHRIVIQRLHTEEPLKAS